MFIEFNGRQHYEFVPYFHKNIQGFYRQQNRDEFIRNWCNQQKKNLLEIRYDQNIIQQLEKYVAMDIITTPPYENMQKLYQNYFSLGNLNIDINNKFALISLICYLKHKISEKKPDITHYQIIKKIVGEDIPEDLIKGLAVVCSDFGYGCTTFPTFGIEDKKIPSKVKEIFSNYLPF